MLYDKRGRTTTYRYVVVWRECIEVAETGTFGSSRFCVAKNKNVDLIGLKTHMPMEETDRIC